MKCFAVFLQTGSRIGGKKLFNPGEVTEGFNERRIKIREGDQRPVQRRKGGKRWKRHILRAQKGQGADPAEGGGAGESGMPRYSRDRRPWKR